MESKEDQVGVVPPDPASTAFITELPVGSPVRNAPVPSASIPVVSDQT